MLITHNHTSKAIAILKKLLYPFISLYRSHLKETYGDKYQQKEETYRVYYNIAAMYMKENTKLEIAYNYMNVALQIANGVFKKDSVESANAYFAIGKIYKKWGDDYNAQNHFRVASDILEGKKGQESLLAEIFKELNSSS